MASTPNPPAVRSRLWLQPTLPLMAVGLGVLAAVIHISPTLSRRLQYDREAIHLHQLWRFVSCHWSHWSVDHLAWDIPTFVLLGALCEWWNRRRFIVLLVAATLLIPLAFHFLEPGVGTYRGLSGIDSGLMMLLLAMVARSLVLMRHLGMVALVGTAFVVFLAKVIVEFSVSSSLFVTWTGTGIVPLPTAHLVGAMVGLIIGLVPSRVAFAERDVHNFRRGIQA